MSANGSNMSGTLIFVKWIYCGYPGSVLRVIKASICHTLYSFSQLPFSFFKKNVWWPSTHQHGVPGEG